jgi:hypothetical protein
MIDFELMSSWVLGLSIMIFHLLQNIRIKELEKLNLILKFRLKKKQNYNNDLLKYLMPAFVINKLNF